ncbi:MAG: tRNA (adenosine(37)-N6)-threonylcarbamoyltransferase complex transferase subunit TsaD [Patescibacteria group bacterium]|nr:tRNA (adenosine(37)-N6)-threonylcarbamoyltransferase complex transferase subunit TsaD [Patescibacteria group bacterium]
MTVQNRKTILAIESSCDETAAAVLRLENSGSAAGFPKIKTLSSVVKSQISLHSKMGGVVPEAAARAHVKNILPVVKKALTGACNSIFDGRQKLSCKNGEDVLSQIDYIAVTAGPGLIPSLIVGVEFAKALSLATGKPVIPVNHLSGHLYSPFGRLTAKSYKLKANFFPMISLIVSGGHTILVLMEDIKHYKVLGQTVDDAAGEAFDKVAKLLGLPYPGGPQIGKLAAKGNPAAINFPRPMINSKDYNFSFAGLKTAVLYYLRDNPPTAKSYKLKTNVCASFQQAVVDVLAAKTLRAANEFKARSISLSGGVSANLALRKSLNLKSKTFNLKFFAPPLSLTGDNAEIIGMAAAFMLFNGYKPKSYKAVKADPNLEL